MDLCREILRMVEEAPTPEFSLSNEWLTDQRRYHEQQLEDAGLLERRSSPLSGDIIVRLTWEGHNFVEASRDQTIWEKAKQVVQQKTGGLALDALKVALGELAKVAVNAAIGAV